MLMGDCSFDINLAYFFAISVYISLLAFVHLSSILLAVAMLSRVYNKLQLFFFLFWPCQRFLLPMF